MNILCDTHVLLWYLLAQDKLSAQAKAYLLNEKNTLYFSVASVWELSIKYSLGRPDFNFDPKIITDELLQQEFKILPIELTHLFSLTHLPFIHRDPFDRLLIVQAETELFRLFTADDKMLAYNSECVFDVR